MGIIPKSPLNADAYDLSTGLLDDAPNITTKYEGSVTNAFDFYNFRFSCVQGAVKSESLVTAVLCCLLTLIEHHLGCLHAS
jgi:hypothetical protein